MTKEEFRQKWVEALRSGEYKQCGDYLHTVSDGQDFYCCLGVACDLYNKTFSNDQLVKSLKMAHSIYYYDDRKCDLPDKVRDMLGLNTREASYLDEDMGTTSLTHNNDLGDSFEKIADIIESNPPQLFRIAPKTKVDTLLDEVFDIFPD